MATTDTDQHHGIDSLSIVTLVVDDQDEALAFYTETLGFEVREDETFELGGATGRWLTVALPGQDLEISLVTPDEPYYDESARENLAARHGGETWWTFRTADCAASVDSLENAGVEITDGPTERPWGTEARFADPFGNAFSLYEYAE